MVKKLCLLAAFFLYLLLTPVYAADDAAMFGMDKKVALHDTLKPTDFVTSYNELCQYPLHDFEQNHGVIDDNTVMMLTVDGENKINRVILMHRGEVVGEEQEKLEEIFAAINTVLGQPQTNEGRLAVTRVFNILKMEDKEMTATRLPRRDINRDYVFMKAYTKNGVLSIVTDAYVAEDGTADEQEN